MPWSTATVKSLGSIHMVPRITHLDRLQFTLLLSMAAARQRLMGPYRPDRLPGPQHLGTSYRAPGVDPVIALCEQVINDRVRLFGADHPDTLVSRTSLAQAYHFARRVDEGRTRGVTGLAAAEWDGIGRVVTIGSETPMTALLPPGQTDLLTDWLKQPRVGSRARRRVEPVPGGLRFAFYGRTSTVDCQDRVSSRSWQYESARDLVAGHGVIVAEFFDVGYSRRLPWAKRPQAAALLAALVGPERGFDAVVVGEYERAFYGDQLRHLATVFEQYGVQLWLPEVHGRLDYRDSTHQALMMLLGAQSRREVLRSRFRTMAAMQAQAREQGRYLGGRPPYGYHLVDAGPHPNAAHAVWGRRLRRLEPNPATAPTVTWIFQQRLAGHAVAAIARALNEQGVPCPSIMDAGRNRHRTRDEWSLRTVAAILANPRTPVGRSGTGNAPTTTHPTTRAGRVEGRCCGGTRPTSGSSPNSSRIRRWSAKPTTWPPNASTLSQRHPRAVAIGTNSSGWCAAGGASVGWTLTGCTTEPDTAAATAEPRRTCVGPAYPRRSTSAKIRSSSASAQP